MRSGSSRTMFAIEPWVGWQRGICWPMPGLASCFSGCVSYVQLHACCLCFATSHLPLVTDDVFAPAAPCRCCCLPAVFYIIYCLPAGMYKEKHDNDLPAFKGIAAKDTDTLPATKSAEVELKQSAPSAAHL